LILASETRELRPTVLTALFKLLRAEFVPADTAVRDTTFPRTRPDDGTLSAPPPENTRDTVLRTAVAVVLFSCTGTRVATRETPTFPRPAATVLFADTPVGITRETAPSAANADGAKNIIAKKHDNSFFILFYQLYHKKNI
jgi:hypothetical protein